MDELIIEVTGGAKIAVRFLSILWDILSGPTAFVSFIFTAQCTLVQSAVLGSHVVRLSVRPSVCNVGGL